MILRQRLLDALAYPRRVASGGVSPAPDLVRPPAEQAVRPAQGAASLLVLGELGLLVLLVRRFDLESAAFQKVLLLATGGAVIHHLLPTRGRLPFFFALSVASVALVLGLGPAGWDAVMGMTRAGVLLAAAVGLVCLCHLPLGLGLKALVIGGAGGCLALFRIGFWPVEYLSPVWTVLASMFMFRVVIYLYDLQHDPRPPSFFRSMSYFLMLPNVCFPLFPVVDYKTFTRSHYSGEALAIYQKGLNWMVRGIIQLILYRAVYYHLYIDAWSVTSGTDLVRFVLSNFLLYLRVSGQFHVIVGLLHLFGFNLPETNRRYLLASSITDYWRRVNIYWKDFVLKVFYNPTYFRIKRHGATLAMVVATVVCFVLTWALHSYQTFWIQGRFPLASRDALFWGILGLLVVGNSLGELRWGRSRALRPRAAGWRQRLATAGWTALTFTIISVLWSLWSADAPDLWWQMWSLADGKTLMYGAAALLVVVGLALGQDAWDALIGRLAGHPGGLKHALARGFSPRVAVVCCVVPAAGLFIISSSKVHARMGESPRSFLASLMWTKPNASELGAMERGYYENLMDLDQGNPGLDVLYTQRSRAWRTLTESDATAPTHDLRMIELKPSKVTEINGVTYTTNRWGMRDRDYPLEKPADTFRIAMIGASTMMGWGVAQHETFENLLEERLNNEPPPGAPCRRFEVLNFAVNSYSSLADIVVLRERVLRFHPDAVYKLANPTDEYWVKQRLFKALKTGTLEVPFEPVRRVMARAGLSPRMSEQAALRRLDPYGGELIAWAYNEMVQECRRERIVPVWFLVPRPSRDQNEGQAEQALLASAGKAGYTILSLGDIYAGYPAGSLDLAPGDIHPNALGNRLIADGLYRALLSEQGELIFKHWAALGPSRTVDSGVSAQPASRSAGPQ